MIQGNQQTTTIDMWPYYEFEDFIKYLNKRNEDEKKTQEKSEGSQNSPDYNQMSKMANNFKMPNFNIPKM